MGLVRYIYVSCNPFPVEWSCCQLTQWRESFQEKSTYPLCLFTQQYDTEVSQNICPVGHLLILLEKKRPLTYLKSLTTFVFCNVFFSFHICLINRVHDNLEFSLKNKSVMFSIGKLLELCSMSTSTWSV